MQKRIDMDKELKELGLNEKQSYFVKKLIYNNFRRRTKKDAGVKMHVTLLNEWTRSRWSDFVKEEQSPLMIKTREYLDGMEK